jgi:uncharacterized Zn finger protein
MCEHKVKKIIATTGTHYIVKCLDCGDEFSEEKTPKKKSFIDKLLRR